MRLIFINIKAGLLLEASCMSATIPNCMKTKCISCTYKDNFCGWSLIFSTYLNQGFMFSKSMGNFIR